MATFQYRVWQAGDGSWSCAAQSVDNGVAIEEGRRDGLQSQAEAKNAGRHIARLAQRAAAREEGSTSEEAATWVDVP